MDSKYLIFVRGILLCTFISVSEQGRVNILEIPRKQVYDIAVLKSQKPVVAFFTKPSCGEGICAQIQADLEAIAKDNNAIMTLAIVDLEKYPEMKSQLGITNIPTTRGYIKGKFQGQVKGPVWNAIQSLVDKMLEGKK